MEYLAHIDGDRAQSIKDHLQGTADLAEEFAAKFGKADWGYCCGMLHDIGKYSAEFQKKIKGNLDIRVDHSTAGGLRKTGWLLLAPDLLHSRASCRVAGSGTRGIAVLFAGET